MRLSVSLAKELLCLRCEILAPINYFVVRDYFSILLYPLPRPASLILLLRPEMPHSKRVLLLNRPKF